MFERYTEKARRVIFFARYEASQFGAPYIGTEHLLLGLLRGDRALTNRFLRSDSTAESIREQIEKNTTIREKVSTSVELPLSSESKRVLAYAAEEAERPGHKHLGTEHLLLGLLREEGSLASAILHERGVKLASVRQGLEQTPHPISEMGGMREPATGNGPAAPGDFTRDLSQAALDGQLEPVLGRELEIDAMIEVLSGSVRANPLLVGESGVGKGALVEGLAQRLAQSGAPAGLAEKRLIALDAHTVAEWVLGGISAGQPVNRTTKVLFDASGSLLVIDDPELFSTAITRSGLALVGNILKRGLPSGKLQCIASCTPQEHLALAEKAPWVVECFRVISVSPLDADTTLRVLQARKGKFETRHSVRYSDDALSHAVAASKRYMPKRRLPGKALELLDSAGARVKLRQASPPAEVAQCSKRIGYIVNRLESAIANHEFEKARFYSEEEKKERENLHVLRQRYHLDEAGSPAVTRTDIEELIERWGKYPYAE